MTQLSAELRRFFARRIVRFSFLLAALIVVISVTGSTLSGHKSGHHVEQVDNFSIDASGQVHHQPENIDTVTKDTRISVGSNLQPALEGTGVAMLFLAFVVGASFVGADFHLGSLTTQLLFEPRRWRVHVAKAIAVGIGAAIVTAAILSLLTAAMYLGSSLRGIVDGVDASWWSHRAGALLRISAVSGVGAAMAYGVTLATKRSSAGIIVFFVQYPLLFLIDPFSHPFGFVSRFEPLRALLALIIAPIHDEGITAQGVHTMAGGLLITVVWTLVVFGLAGRLFSRTEVR